MDDPLAVLLEKLIVPKSASGSTEQVEEQEEGASAIHSADELLKLPLCVVVKLQPRDDDIDSV